MSTLNIFAQHMRELRLRSGMSLRQFAKVVDIDASTISRLECGKTAPPKSSKTLDKLAEALSLKKGLRRVLLFYRLGVCRKRSSHIYRQRRCEKILTSVFKSVLSPYEYSTG